jgi:hypothetical protein
MRSYDFGGASPRQMTGTEERTLSAPVDCNQKVSAISYLLSAISHQRSGVAMHYFHAITGFTKVFAHIFGDHD